MGRILTEDAVAEQLRSFEHTAFRLELQPEYAVDDDRGLVKRFLDGDLTPPIDDIARGWFEQVADQVAEGKRVERVRVFEDPPTAYQRWLRWSDRWNIEAGESIRYMTRQRAREVGLLPAAGDQDWWLFDSCRLVIMRFDGGGSLIESELTTDPERIVQACAWRDLATHHSADGRIRGQAA